MVIQTQHGSCGSAFRAPAMGIILDFTPSPGGHQCATLDCTHVVWCSLSPLSCLAFFERRTLTLGAKKRVQCTSFCLNLGPINAGADLAGEAKRLRRVDALRDSIFTSTADIARNHQSTCSGGMERKLSTSRPASLPKKSVNVPPRNMPMSSALLHDVMEVSSTRKMS